MRMKKWVQCIHCIVYCIVKLTWAAIQGGFDFSIDEDTSEGHFLILKRKGDKIQG